MRVAIDTNILVYIEGVNSRARQVAATALISRLSSARTVLPAQVISELFNVLTRKAGRPAASARLACAQWAATYEVVPTSAEVLDECFEIEASHQFASWDAIILAAATQAGCRYLLSEDMQSGFVWRGVTVVNPFAGGVLPAGLVAMFTR